MDRCRHAGRSLMPMMPQIEAGRSTEPRTWLPVASGNIDAATAAAEPDDEPPGVRARSHGFQVGPGSAMVSSVVTVLPTISAPPRRSASTCAASTAGRLSANRPLLHSVGKPATSKQSLIATGSPSTTDSGRPARQRVAAASAARRAPSESSRTKARTFGSSSAMRARQRSRYARGVSRLARNDWRASLNDR